MTVPITLPDWEESPKCQTLLQRWVQKPDTGEWRRKTKSKDTLCR